MESVYGDSQLYRYKRYTGAEIVHFWDMDGQGHIKAFTRGDLCVVVPHLNLKEAITLSALFIRSIFAIPTCTHYSSSDRTLSLYCGEAGAGCHAVKFATEMLVLGFLAGAGRNPIKDLLATESFHARVKPTAPTPVRDAEPDPAIHGS